jgi:hypothetical protein
VSGVRFEVVNAATVPPAIGLMVTVPAATEVTGAVTDPVAAVPSRWLRKSNWKN